MAVIAAKAADRFAANLPPGCGMILLHGPNASMIADLARVAAASFAARGPDKPEIHHMECDRLADEPGVLLDEVSTGSLFGGRKVIRMKLGRRQVAGAIELAAPRVTGSHLVIIDGGEIKGDHALVKFFKAGDNLAVITCWDDDPAEWNAWLARQETAAGVKLQPEARALLLELHGRERGIVRMELEKLSVYAGGKTEISAADIEALSHSSLSEEYDALVDAALGGNREAVAADPLMISGNVSNANAALAFLMRQLNILRSIQAKKGSGPADDFLLQRSGVNFRRQGAVRRQLENWPVSKIDIALADAWEAVLNTRRAPQQAASLAGRAFLTTAQAAKERG